MKHTTISMSNAIVMTNSPTSRILAGVGLMSTPRVAWRTSEVRASATQDHLIFSYTSLTVFLRAVWRCTSGAVVHASSCSSTMAWRMRNALDRVSDLIAEKKRIRDHGDEQIDK